MRESRSLLADNIPCMLQLLAMIAAMAVLPQHNCQHDAHTAIKIQAIDARSGQLVSISICQILDMAWGDCRYSIFHWESV